VGHRRPNAAPRDLRETYSPQTNIIADIARNVMGSLSFSLWDMNGIYDWYYEWGYYWD
jgi:hypothetical protein